MGIAEEVIGWWAELQCSSLARQRLVDLSLLTNSTCNVKCNQCGDAFSNVMTLMKHEKALVAAFFKRAAMFGRSILSGDCFAQCKLQYSTVFCFLFNSFCYFVHCKLHTSCYCSVM